MMAVLFSLACISAKYADTGLSSEETSSGSNTDTDTDTDTSEIDCSINWDGWTDGFFATYCRACHSATTAERYGAPAGVDFDTREDVLQWAERIRVRVLEEETMPLGGGVVQAELEPLDRWLWCVENRS